MARSGAKFHGNVSNQGNVLRVNSTVTHISTRESNSDLQFSTKPLLTPLFIEMTPTARIIGYSLISEPRVSKKQKKQYPNSFFHNNKDLQSLHGHINFSYFNCVYMYTGTFFITECFKNLNYVLVWKFSLLRRTFPVNVSDVPSGSERDKWAQENFRDWFCCNLSVPRRWDYLPSI